MAAEAKGSVDAVFRALADPTRRQILKLLRKTGLPAGSVAAAFPISGPSISRHLSVLKAAGLVSERRDANRLIYSLEASQLAEVTGAWLLTVCPDDLSDALLKGRKRKEKEKTSRRGAGKGSTGKESGGRGTSSSGGGSEVGS